MVARSEWDWGRYQEGVGIKSGFPISYFTYLFNGVMARKNMKTNCLNTAHAVSNLVYFLPLELGSSEGGDIITHEVMLSLIVRTVTRAATEVLSAQTELLF